MRCAEFDSPYDVLWGLLRAALPHASDLGPSARDAAGALAGLPPPIRSRVLEHADDHRVLLPVAEALRAQDEDAAIPEPVRARLRRLEELRRINLRLLVYLGELFEGLGVPYACFKGFATEDSYPPGYVRQFNDVDLMVPDLLAFWRATRMMVELGFSLDHLTLRGDPDEPGACGIAVLRRDSQTLPGHKVKVEIEAGGQALWWSSAQAHGADAFEHVRRLSLDPRVGLPPAGSMLKVLVGEMIGRPGYLLRDVLDFLVLRARLTEQERADVREASRRNGLEHELVALERVADAAATGLPPVRAMWVGKERTRPTTWMRTSARTALFHAWPYARRRRGRLGGLTALVRDLGREAIASSWAKELIASSWASAVIPRWMAWANSRVDVRGVLSRGSVVHFTKVGASPSGPVTWIEDPGATLLLCPLGVFVPCVFPSMSEGHVERCLEVFTRFVETSAPAGDRGGGPGLRC